jgi:hypothetical protein
MRELKDSQTAIVLEQPQALQPITPLSMIQLALQQGMGPEVLRDLFKLKKEVEADEARKAYDMAFAAFKAQTIRIVKNIEVAAGPLNGKKSLMSAGLSRSGHAKLSSKHGLSSSLEDHQG